MTDQRLSPGVTFRSTFLWALLLYGAAIWPIVRADRFYIDDLGRSLSGYMGWSRDGRPLANVVMEILNLGTPLTDLSPLPQLLSGLLIAYLAAQVAQRFDAGSGIRPALICAPLLVSPFYLENLSYKFDALTMTLSVFLAVSVTLHTRAGLRGTLLGTLGLIASLCLYQPATNAFIVFSAVELSLMQWRDVQIKEVMKAGATRLFQLVIALGTYKAIATSLVRGDYAARYGQLEPLENWIAVIGRNLVLFWGYVLHALPSLGGRLILAWIAFGCIAALFISARYAARQWSSCSPGHRAGLVLVTTLIAPLLLIAPWGPMLALTEPSMVPRVFVGVGALSAGSLLILSAIASRSALRLAWQTAAIAVPVYAMLVFALVYGNTLKLQKAHENTLAIQISNDLAAGAASGPFLYYTLLGTAGRAPVAQHNLKKYPLLAGLVPAHLTQGWGWGPEQLRHFGVTLPDIPSDAYPERVAQACSSSPVVQRAGYRLYEAGDLAIVAFGDSCSHVRPTGR